jgi:hypothetical protein
MHTLTKEQILKLTPEQQEAVGALEANHAKKQQRLLDEARWYRGKIIFPVFLVVSGLGLFFFHAPTGMLLAYGIFGCYLLIQFHAAGVNRRLDALIELLDSEKKRSDDDG